MAKNTLFNFLNSRFTRNTLIPECKKITLDTNKENNQYYRLELLLNEPVFLRVNNQAYELLNHHISIYETEKLNNPQLSQYHYTAYFTDDGGEIFRLHVYFDANDELTMNAVFAKEEEENKYIPIETGQLDNDLINLAITYVKPVIASLRKEQHKIIEQLEEDFYKLEKEAAELFQGQEESSEEYCNKLESICDVLKALAPLVTHNLYLNKLRFFRNIQKTLAAESTAISSADALHPPTELIQEDFFETEEDNSVEEISSSLSENKTPPQSKRKKRTKTADRAEQNLRQLSIEQQLLKQLDRTAQAQKLEDLLSKIEVFSLKHQKEKLSLSTFAELQRLHREIYSLGEKVFPTLLFERKFDLAKQLVSWHHLLNEKYLNLSLQTKNLGLLDFTLTHGHFNLTNQKVTIKDKVYPSAVHACFALDSKQSPMGDCLSILLKHGASLCVTNEKGLPLAYAIMSVPNHPFKAALLANRDKTLDSVKFLKELRFLLKNCLTAQFSQEEKESILEEIDYCNSHLNFLLQPDLNTSSAKFFQKKSDEFIERHLGKIIKKLRTDPEITFLMTQMDACSRRLVSLLGKGKTMVAQRQGADTLDSLDKLLVNYKIEMDNFDEVKSTVIKQLRGQLQLVSKRIELVEMQNDMVRCQGRWNRTQKKLVEQQKVLLREIAELEKEYDLQHQVEAVQKMEDELKQLETVTRELKKMLHSLSNLEDSSLTGVLNALPKLEPNEDSSKHLVKALTTFSSIFHQFSAQKSANENTEDEKHKCLKNS
ncbi:hypothetical protein [Legionella clemsonensis]|uniref:Coiled-coil-containing protein n=1 Tax=Legionella clemsonensis TaxID=1867846 RepID=A0A222P2P5_9GAMM|nr:hypothetical protein [Legionella clemsonensis]ASQ46120.1 hypothetical protein clem_07835 [Legionella clemsonensis]